MTKIVLTGSSFPDQPPLKPLHKRLFHWGPILALSITGVITVSTIMCLMSYWPPGDSLAGGLNLVIFIFWNYMTVSNLFSAAYFGPGYVPMGWTPDAAKSRSNLQSCVTCEGYKAPRSHHCRKCDRCVMKMDHHCPWINNCVGHRNHQLFLRFLLFSTTGCAHATTILAPSIWYAVFRVWYYYHGTGREPYIDLSLTQLLMCIFSFGLAVGCVCAIGFLFYVQVRTVLTNRTAIEDWIVTKADYRNEDSSSDEDDKEEGANGDVKKERPAFVFPYDLGWRRNGRLVFGFSSLPPGDGINWDVRADCDAFTLTREQLKQKASKRKHVVEYTALNAYSGSWLPVSYGCKTCCCIPMTDEPRISLDVGDRVIVSRAKKYWLYGERVEDGGDYGQSREARGWFPRTTGKRSKDVTADERQKMEKKRQ